MEIQSNDRGRRPQCVQNVACSAHVDRMRTHGCMASALGPLVIRPDFHVHDSSCIHVLHIVQEGMKNCEEL